jgi:hypothetical protein
VAQNDDARRRGEGRTKARQTEQRRENYSDNHEAFLSNRHTTEISSSCALKEFRPVRSTVISGYW